MEGLPENILKGNRWFCPCSVNFIQYEFPLALLMENRFFGIKQGTTHDCFIYPISKKPFRASLMCLVDHSSEVLWFCRSDTWMRASLSLVALASSSRQ